MNGKNISQIRLTKRRSGAQNDYVYLHKNDLEKKNDSSARVRLLT